MEYKKITIKIKPYNSTVSDILIAQMGEVGSDTFCETEDGFEAYLPVSLYDEEKISKLNPIVENVEYEWTSETIIDEDWNKTWEEQYFTPINIDNRCLIRSTLHEKIADTEYEILINPEMSFGSGHHETTCHMIRFLLDNDVRQKDVLDMGCGTGILGILASKRGARNVRGIDIDEWSYKNAKENIRLNAITNMSVAVGNAQLLLEESNCYDIVLANINRNILLNDMATYVAVIRDNGFLVMSGFYEKDVSMITECALNLGLRKIDTKVDNDWTMITFVKQ